MAAHHIASILFPVMLSTDCAQDGQDKAPTGYGHIRQHKPSGLDAMSRRQGRRGAAQLAGSGLVELSAPSVSPGVMAARCPAPGMSYTMALVPGCRIRLRAAGNCPLPRQHARCAAAVPGRPVGRALPGDHRV
jgi:hypothetical protein